MTTVSIGQLVLNWDYYPRASVNSKNTTGIKAGIKAGNKIPPIVAWKGRNWIVDGFHRYYAYMQVYGADYRVPVTLKEYDTEADFFVDSVAYNSTHGQQLTTADEARIVLLSDSLGLPRERLEGVLPRERIKEVAQFRATAPEGVYTKGIPIYVGNQQMVPLKRVVVEDLGGAELTQDQANALAVANATPKLTMLKQITMFLKAGMIPHLHGPTYSYMYELSELIERWHVEEAKLREERKDAKNGKDQTTTD